MKSFAAYKCWETPEWKALAAHAAEVQKQHLRDLLQDPRRFSQLSASYDGILLDYTRQQVTPQTIELLYKLADSANLKGRINAMLSGEKLNVTEGRSVMHTALRAPATAKILVDGVNVVPEVHSVLKAIEGFSEKIRQGQHVGCTGKPLTTVVSIGIGGSYLGPEFVFESLKSDPAAKVAAAGRTLRFLANVDPIDLDRATAGLDPETVLVVIVSKTFTTAETMLNARSLRSWLVSKLSDKAKEEDIISHHVIAVTSAVSKAVSFGIQKENIFGFWDWVGGRYSVCSAVGMVPLSLHYGFGLMRQFLDGAASVDKNFGEAPYSQNLPVLLGLLGVWNSSFLGYSTRALLPYCQSLLRFPAHIQQVDMESNGKRVTMDGTVLPIATGEIDFGEPGTNGQHSFYQLIHQGRVIPCDFIGFKRSQNPFASASEPVSNHDELMSNFFAQPDALACGKTLADLEKEGVPPALRPHKEFPGNRPSLSLLFPVLNAYSTGQLLALYEHRTAVEGFIWNVCSFDQWGVELGKVLATKVRTQMQSSRAGTAAISGGFNPCTEALLKAYLA